MQTCARRQWWLWAVSSRTVLLFSSMFQPSRRCWAQNQRGNTEVGAGLTVHSRSKSPKWVREVLWKLRIVDILECRQMGRSKLSSKRETNYRSHLLDSTSHWRRINLNLIQSYMSKIASVVTTLLTDLRDKFNRNNEQLMKHNWIGWCR